jgi:very-short-patch-repair endonuclease
MTFSESIELFNTYTASKYPKWVFQFSDSKLAQFRKLQKSGGSWESSIEKSLLYIGSLTNFGVYWYNLGVRDPLLIELYKSDINWRVCKICKNIYHRARSELNDFKAFKTCSYECNKISRLAGGVALSNSKKLYNSKDPLQYSKRHNISLEEANKITQSFIRKNSNRCPEYWISLGYNEEESVQMVSLSQKRNSKRSVEYWIKQGFTEEQAKEQVSEYQSYFSKQRGDFNPENSWLCIEYYLKRGYSVEDGLYLKRQKLKESGETLKRISGLKTKEERLSDNPRHISFYIKRGISEEDGISKIAEIFKKSRNKTFVSEISREFCNKLEKFYPDDSLYHDDLNKEFFIYSSVKRGIYLYDFTNTTKDFIVEFHGNYWHSESNKNWTQSADDAKFLAAEKRGFKVFTVWEKTYKEDKDMCVLNLVNEIKEWYENC